jgi:HEAT repeat protein
MSNENQRPEISNKKILESSPLSGISVPLAIVLVGGLIIFGVTKMLSTGKDHRDLIQEMNSKTFGNRWVAAYELSKFLASSKIPPSDMPWVIENLSKVYFESVDGRTRNFVVLALGTLKDPQILQVLNKALEDQDPQVKFNAVVSIGNMASSDKIDWPKIESLINQETDTGLRQVALLAYASHRQPGAEQHAIKLLEVSDVVLRYAAATVLIHFKNQATLPILNEILSLKYDVAQEGKLNGSQVENLKLNVLENMEKTNWKEVAGLVEKTLQNDPNIRVQTKAKQVLKVLKN